MFGNMSLRRAMTFSMPAGEEGGAGPIGGGETGGETSPAAPAQPQENVPPYQEYLDRLPDDPAIRSIVEGAFKDWDASTTKKFQSIHEEYKPFKGKDPQRVEASLGLAEMLERDPQGFYELLGQQLGITAAQAQQVVEESSNSDDDDDDAGDNPQLAEIKQQQEQFQQYIAQQEQQRLMAEQQEQMNSELAAIEAKHGKMTPTVRNQVLREALLMSQETGEVPRLADAYARVEAFVTEVRAVPRPGETAPLVLPSGGAVPLTPSKPLGEMTNGETKELVAERLARAFAEGN